MTEDSRDHTRDDDSSPEDIDPTEHLTVPQSDHPGPSASRFPADHPGPSTPRFPTDRPARPAPPRAEPDPARAVVEPSGGGVGHPGVDPGALPPDEQGRDRGSPWYTGVPLGRPTTPSADPDPWAEEFPAAWYTGVPLGKAGLRPAPTSGADGPANAPDSGPITGSEPTVRLDKTMPSPSDPWSESAVAIGGDDAASGLRGAGVDPAAPTGHDPSSGPPEPEYETSGPIDLDPFRDSAAWRGSFEGGSAGWGSTDPFAMPGPPDSDPYSAQPGYRGVPQPVPASTDGPDAGAHPRDPSATGGPTHLGGLSATDGPTHPGGPLLVGLSPDPGGSSADDPFARLGGSPSSGYPGSTSAADPFGRPGVNPATDPFGLPPSTRRIEPTPPPPPRSRLLLGAAAGLIAGLLVFGSAGWFTGRATAPPATASPAAAPQAPAARPSAADGLFEQTQAALNRQDFAGTKLTTLTSTWLSHLATCGRSGDPAAGEKARVRCTVGGMSAVFVEFESVRARDTARGRLRRQSDDARRLAPGRADPGPRVTPSGRIKGNYVEYAYELTEGGVTRTVAGIWWDDAQTPIAAYLLAYWKDSLNERWEPMRDLWSRYA